MRKQFFGCLAALCLPIFLFAQEKTRMFVFAGPQASTARYYIDGSSQPTQFKYGGQAGVGAKIFFDKNLYFSPALLYSSKGYKVEYNRFSTAPGTNVTANNTQVHTMELALLLQYDFKKQPTDGCFFLRFGPSIDFHLAGTETLTVQNGTSYDKKQNMHFSFVSYGRYGLIATAHAGYQTKSGWELVAKYGLGMSDMHNLDRGPAINHRTLAFTIGKYLGK